ncbi:nuclear transport factor 2 family protein [Massilia sp. B-10]|nr:nuclear transport factor 2 family protein [Massilia sp. B-10]UUZ54128.1 nuclear transport factor 2 family protein [Massilia sp. H-1]
MIRHTVLALLLGAAAVPACAAPVTAGARESLAAFYAALAAGDKARALELLAPSVTIYESGYVEASRDEYAQHHLGGDIAFAKRSTRKVLKHSEKIEGNMALIWEETETTGTSDGKPVHALGTETAMLEQKDGRWQITHVHWSSRKAK